MSVRFFTQALDLFSEFAAGLEVETIWSRLVASLERAARAVAAIGMGSYVVRAHGMDFLVQDGVVVSVRTSRKR